MVEPGIEPGTSRLVDRDPDHQTTRLVLFAIVYRTVCITPILFLITSFLTFNGLEVLALLFKKIHFCTKQLFLESAIHCQNFHNCILKCFPPLCKILPYFSIDNAHLMYNAHPKLFRQITRMTLTSGRVRKYRPLLTEDTGVIPKNVPGQQQ